MSRKIEKKRAVAAAATAAASDGVGPSGGDNTLNSAIKSEIHRVVMGLMPPELKSKKKTKTQQARAAAQQVQAKITTPSGATKKYSTLLWYLPHLISRDCRKRRGKGGQGADKPQEKQQQRKSRVVVAKVEGTVNPKRTQKKSKGKKKKSRQ